MARRIKNFTLSTANYDQGITPGDDVNVKTCVGLEGYDAFCINLTAGSCRVFGSLDGANYMAKQLILSQEPPNTGDSVTAQNPVYVGVVTANIPAWFFGDYKSIRIQQEGGTAPVGIVSAAGEKF